MSETIIITGASRGIGRAAALRLAESGKKLLLASFQNPDALAETASEARRLGAETEIFTGDLSDPEICRRLMQTCTEAFGTPDALINNAGISRVELFQDSDAAALQKLLNTNLSSVINLSREAAKLMLKKHAGRILNISSVWGITGASCEVEYSAAKGGVNAFTKALAKELAPSGIAVNALAPGAIDTEMNSRLSPEERAGLEESIPFGRMGTPEETAEMIALLLQAPLYLTGTVIPFDGAWI